MSRCYCGCRPRWYVNWACHRSIRAPYANNISVGFGADASRQRSSGPGPQGGVLAWALKVWSVRGDLTALVQDGMLLLFLLAMTGVAYPMLLDLAPALV